jgi:hypothetical protein
LLDLYSKYVGCFLLAVFWGMLEILPLKKKCKAVAVALSQLLAGAVERGLRNAVMAPVGLWQGWGPEEALKVQESEQGCPFLSVLPLRCGGCTSAARPRRRQQRAGTSAPDQGGPCCPLLFLPDQLQVRDSQQLWPSDLSLSNGDAGILLVTWGHRSEAGGPSLQTRGQPL